MGLSAKYLFRAKSVGDAELNHTIVDILERYGQVKAMSLIAKNSNEMLIRCEFFDADAVEPALVGIKDLKLKVSHQEDSKPNAKVDCSRTLSLILRVMRLLPAGACRRRLLLRPPTSPMTLF